MRAIATTIELEAIMKALPATIFLTIALQAVSGSFSNLGFENAWTNQVRIAAADVLPRATASDLLAGWTILKASAEEENVCFNSAPLGLGYVTVVPKEGQFAGGEFYPVDGAYALIVAPTGPHWGQANPITLTQRGQVPAGARTISFLNFGAPFEVRINGRLIPLKYEDVDPGRGYLEQVLRRATGDVSAFAGQEVELSFIARYKETAPFIHGLDRIEFGPAPSRD